ncbi:hypothetical protein [Elongatibacter sediminis]|uniref:Uncharacterized protein n=1 Tax=Elongatibacter sediminis TaxID=3119006 RepID=A0AAW9RCH4_9GAMM
MSVHDSGQQPNPPGVTTSREWFRDQPAAIGSVDPRDPYIEYDFTQTGVYYLRVGQDGGLPVPLAGTYELQCSLEGGDLPVQLLFKDGFE